MAADLVVSVQLETAPDVWLELEDEPAGYEIGAGSFVTQQVSHRKRNAGEVPWVEGSVTIASVRENITEPLEIIVSAATNYDFTLKRNVVTNALEQLSFRIRKHLGNAMEEWTCVPSDYSIESDQPLMVATMGIIKTQVEHLPAVVLTEV